MAGEITVTVKLSVSKGSLSQTMQPSGVQVLDMSGSNAGGGVQSIASGGTTGEALIMGDVGTAGWGYFRNIDTTNFIEIGVQVAGTFYPFAKLKAGEAGLIRLGTSAPYARANTAAANLQYWIISD